MVEDEYKVAKIEAHRIHSFIKEQLIRDGEIFGSKSIFWCGRDVDDIFGEWIELPSEHNDNNSSKYHAYRNKVMDMYNKMISESEIANKWERGIRNEPGYEGMPGFYYCISSYPPHVE